MMVRQVGSKFLIEGTGGFLPVVFFSNNAIPIYELGAIRGSGLQSNCEFDHQRIEYGATSRIEIFN
jgi:hypothetical protein